MKLLDGLVLRPLGSEFFVTGEGLSRIDFNKLVSMNTTAAYLWKELQGCDFTLDDMVEKLTGRYEVDSETARTDAQKLLASWRDAGLIEE